ncbi:MAG TPA: hypothetical protein VGO52_11465 [Hyphomonadaceae bacterium]|jgi:hypothetical protein|nr:hypothetical protein [Hyphomonadaceae bacterium]
MKPGWFGPKRFGIGVAPRSWQGWVVSLGAVAILAAVMRWVRPAISEALGLPLPLATGIIVVAWLALLGAVIALTYDGAKT